MSNASGEVPGAFDLRAGDGVESLAVDREPAEAEEKGVRGKEITPFMLAKVVELTGGDSLATNIQLALNNARCAAKIAAELAKL